MRPVLICGAPGVGKTSVVRALLGAAQYDEETRWTIGAKYAAAGRYTGAVYDGPDLMPLSRALLQKTLERAPRGYHVLLDGERYAAAEVLDARTVDAVLLTAKIDVLRARRARRGSEPMPDDWYTRRIERAGREAKRQRVICVVDASRALALVVRDVDTAIRRRV